MLSDVYQLRSADVPLVDFTFVEDDFGTPSVDIVAVHEDGADMLPWGITLDGEGLYSWLSSRSLPHNRRYAAELCSALGISIDDVQGIYDVSAGLSLNDSYWVPKADDPRSFSSVNLYENGFSALLAAVAYTGTSPVGPGRTPHGLTPELTTDGSLRKAWRVMPDGARALYKGASNGWYPGEPASELVASFIALSCGLDAVAYSIDLWDGELCSTCGCFCSPRVSYVPFAVATGITDLAGTLAYASRLGQPSLEACCDMLILDCLIYNPDRHFTNFGLLRDSAGGGLLGFAPIFDNGRGLFPMTPNDMIVEFKYQAAVMRPAFGGNSFDQLASRVMGERQLGWLERAEHIDFSSLKESLLARLPKKELNDVCDRIDLLSEVVSARAAELCGIKPVDRHEFSEKLADVWESRDYGTGEDIVAPDVIMQPVAGAPSRKASRR